MRGLLLRDSLKEDEALLITSCNSVHMFGMKYAIDLVYLDKNWKVLKLVQQLKPWRISACKKANMVVELPANRLKILGITNGQKIEWENEN